MKFKSNVDVEAALAVSGDVGVGTTAPLRKLHVAGGNGFAVNASASQYYGVYIPALGEGADPRIDIGDWHNAGSTIKWDSSARSLNLDTQYSTGAGTFNITGNDGASTFLTVLPSGNVGIGTTSPNAKLEVLSTTVPQFRLTHTDSTYYMTMSHSGIFDIIDSGGSNKFDFRKDGSSQMVISTTGNVGIGTTSPGDPLHILSGGTDDFIRIENTNTYTGLWMNDGGTNNGWLVMSGYTNTPSAGDFAIREYGVQTSLVIKQTSGNVGIGTISPENLLHVKASDGNTAVIKIEGGNNVVTANGEINSRLEFGSNDGSVNSSGNVGGSIASVTENTNGAITGLAFSTFYQSRTPNDLAEAMRITGAGNVGIGTTSPTHLLTLETASSPGLKIKDTTQGATLLAFSQDSNSHVGTFSSHPLVFDTNSTERMRITSAGNVGIGTNNPAQKLDVVGKMKISDDIILAQTNGRIDYDNGVSSGALRFFSTSGNTERMRIASSGNVGIGTTSPSKKLHVNGSYKLGTNAYIQYDAAYPYTINIQNTASAGDIKLQSANGENKILLQPSTGGIDFYTNSSERMRITDGGNVGIGTTSPGYKLDVRTDTGVLVKGASGSVDGRIALVPASGGRQYGLRNYGSSFGIKDESADVVRMYFHYDGNVGIGTTSPGAKLEVRSDGSAAGGAEIRLQHANNNTNDVVSTVNFANNAGSVGMIQAGTAGANNTGYIALFTDIAGSSSERMRVHTNGNVGIGTTNPSAPLSLAKPSLTTTGTGEGGLRVHRPNAISQYGYFDYGFNEGGVNIGSLYTGGGATSFGTFTFRQHSSTTSQIPMFINNIGNVGIGTTNPQSKLQVAGGIQMADDTATASAGKVGTMRYRTGTEYVEVNGVELVTNGDFATDTGWTKDTGWAIGGGTANGTAAVTPLYQTVSGFTAGSKYRVRFEVTAVTSGYIRVYAYVGASGTFTNIFSTTSLTTGTYEGVFEFGGANKILRFYGSVSSTGGFTGSIDNISVLEVTEESASYADMCMQTGSSTYEWVNIVRNTY